MLCSCSCFRVFSRHPVAWRLHRCALISLYSPRRAVISSLELTSNHHQPLYQIIHQLAVVLNECQCKFTINQPQPPHHCHHLFTEKSSIFLRCLCFAYFSTFLFWFCLRPRAITVIFVSRNKQTIVSQQRAISFPYSPLLQKKRNLTRRKPLRDYRSNILSIITTHHVRP